MLNLIFSKWGWILHFHEIVLFLSFDFHSILTWYNSSDNILARLSRERQYSRSTFTRARPYFKARFCSFFIFFHSSSFLSCFPPPPLYTLSFVGKSMVGAIFIICVQDSYNFIFTIALSTIENPNSPSFFYFLFFWGFFRFIIISCIKHLIFGILWIEFHYDDWFSCSCGITIG